MNNKREIIWNIVNSCLAAGLVTLGALSDGDISMKGFLFALVAGAGVMITKFKDYWDSEKKEYCSPMFTFIG